MIAERRALALLVVVAVLLAGAAGAGCKGEPKRAPPDEQDVAVGELVLYERTRHAEEDFRGRASSNRVLGPDPYALVALPRASEGPAPREPRFVGLLRGSERVVLLDDALGEVSRAEAPALSDALAIAPDGLVLTAGAASGMVERLRVAEGRFVRGAPLDLTAGDPRRGIRALAVHPTGAVYAADETRDALVVATGSRAPYVIGVPEAPFRLVATPHFLVVASLLGHALTVFRLDEEGAPVGEPTVVRHDGPFWSIAAEERDGALDVVAGGVEDHPLDRTGGSFAYVDSYLYVYRIEESGVSAKLAALNLSERGVVTPKALAITHEGRGVRVLGYGSPRALDLVWPAPAGTPDFSAAPIETSSPAPPGVSAIVAVDDDTAVLADPLIDAWVRTSKEGARVVSVGGDLRSLPRTDASRLGEALFFTGLMSPWEKSDGPLSRFTCETCHFEGGVDGRTHRTGRGDIVATTKPLRGLFGNAPHFTRALDKTLAGMVHAEFRVAAENTGHSPWFSLDEAIAAGADAFVDDEGRGFVDLLVAHRATLDGTPKGLRRALMDFLIDLSPRPNPAVLGRERFDWPEGEGARGFAGACAPCPAPRRAANDPSSAVPFEDWEEMIFGASAEIVPGTIVWARDGYEKTGVEPYVHPDGARPTSLRRLAQKRPYFTNGSARTLAEVLARARVSDGRFWHDGRGAPPGADLHELGPDEQVALLAFLELL